MNIKRLDLVLPIGTGLIAALALLALLGCWAQDATVGRAPGLAAPAGGASSPIDQGSAIRYVATTGTDSGDCTGAGAPCRTVQYALDQALDGDEVRVATGVYTHVNDYGGLAQVVYLTRSLTIRGGYTTTDWAASAPISYPTTLDAQGGGRVLYIAGQISPTLEGLRITGGDATGLAGGPSGTIAALLAGDGPDAARAAGADAGGGLLVITAAATLQRNWIYGNVANYGGGAYLENSPALLSGNLISDNVAVEQSGGGLYLEGGAATLRANRIISNAAQLRWGGGLVLSQSDAHLEGNTIARNRATQGGGGLLLMFSSAGLTGNLVAENYAELGGGVQLWSSNATLASNLFLSNTANLGGGLYLYSLSDVRQANDVVADNQVQIWGSALYVRGSDARLTHTTLARNHGGDGSGVYVTDWSDTASRVAMTNTLFVSHTLGVTVTAGNTVTLEGVLWYSNGRDTAGGGAISVTHAVTGHPAFATDGYHVTVASAGLDRGVPTVLSEDIDGHHRPYNGAPDLGADELIALSGSGIASSLVYTDARGNPTVIQVPAAAITEAVALVYTPQETATAPQGLRFARHAFDLEAYHDGVSVPGWRFSVPVSVTVHYATADVSGLDEASLELDYWDGGAWTDAALTCDPAATYTRRPEENWFALPLCHLSRFGAFGVTINYQLYLPAVCRQCTNEGEPPSPPPPAPPSGFARWRAADGDFGGWERAGVALGADGQLQLDLGAAPTGNDPYPAGGYYGHDFYNGGSFWVGEASSPVMTAPFSFEEGVASWNADTPPGTWVETLARARLGERWTKWYNLGIWAADGSAVERHSVTLQGDGDGYVAVDTLVVTNDAQPVSAYQLKMRLFSQDGVAFPTLRNASFAFSQTLETASLPPGNPDLWDRVLPVPQCSQMVYPDGGRVWCSPTSTAMVLKYWEADGGPCEPDVRAAVAGVYDWLYDGHGNWPFNTAYAATQGLEGYVARFDNLAQAEKWIAAGVPVVFSLAWDAGELTGAPLLWSDGHLLVLVGFDADGDPVVNDPGAPGDDSVRRTYIREEFESLWLEHTTGTVYLIYPPHWTVPDF